MEGRILCIVVLAGLYTFASCLHHRKHYFVNKEKVWKNALKYCQKEHTDLATISDQKELEDLAGLIGSGVTEAFVGLKKQWGWTRSDAGDHKEGEPAFRNWVKDAGSDDCVVMRYDGKWLTCPCSNNHRFFCYNGSTTNISERFVLEKVHLNWAQARAHCRGQQMVLARVRDKLDNQELKKLLASMPRTESWSWIGLTRSFLLWSDGSEATFTPWKPLQAFNAKKVRCGVLQVNSNSLGMTNINCLSKKAFFCYQDFPAPMRKHLVRLTLTTDGSSLNMSAPAVQEAILKWVEKTLRDQGKSEHLKLSWTKPPEKVENTKKDQSEEGMGRP